MTPYLVHGFHRDNSKGGTVCMLVDAAEYFESPNSPHEIAARIAGDGFNFHASQNVSVPVPDDYKNVLFNSDKELYARVPELAWRAAMDTRRAGSPTLSASRGNRSTRACATGRGHSRAAPNEESIPTNPYCCSDDISELERGRGSCRPT